MSHAHGVDQTATLSAVRGAAGSLSTSPTSPDGTQPIPRPPCGTMTAVWRHLKHKETPLDEACRARRLRYVHEWREARRQEDDSPQLPAHGTRERYEIHKLKGRVRCRICMDAEYIRTDVFDPATRLAYRFTRQFFAELERCGGSREEAIRRVALWRIASILRGATSRSPDCRTSGPR
jgi:hypothetical protein